MTADDLRQLEFVARALGTPGAYTNEERAEFATFVRKLAKTLEAEDTVTAVRTSLLEMLGALRHVEREFASGFLRISETEAVPDTPENRLTRILYLLKERWNLTELK